MWLCVLFDSIGLMEVEVVWFGIGRGLSVMYLLSVMMNKDGVIDF